MRAERCADCKWLTLRAPTCPRGRLQHALRRLLGPATFLLATFAILAHLQPWTCEHRITTAPSILEKDAGHRLCRCLPRHRLWGLSAAGWACPASPACGPAADAARPGGDAGSWGCAGGGSGGFRRTGPGAGIRELLDLQTAAQGLRWNCSLDVDFVGWAAAGVYGFADDVGLGSRIWGPTLPRHVFPVLLQTAPRSRRASVARMSLMSASRSMPLGLVRMGGTLHEG